MTSHNPGRHIYNADAAHALPAVLAEAVFCSRPGVLEILPALPDGLPDGVLTGLRARGRVRVHRLSWNLADRRAELSVTSDVDQEVTLISRRGAASVSVSAAADVAPSPLGGHARRLTLRAGEPTEIVVVLGG